MIKMVSLRSLFINDKDALNSNGGSSSSESGSYSDSGSSDYGSTNESNTSTDASESVNEIAEQKAREALIASISNMKDSNISEKQKINPNDLWNKTALQKQNDAWVLKEEVFLYTFHDKEQHRYLNSISIDLDKGDILGTCQIYFPYNQKLMEYWIPGKTTFAIVGGTFDREILFVGRVGEINQRGDQIEMVGHNVGWKIRC